MFERFHADARQAVVVARREAALLGQRDIGCSHLLLGIMSEPDGPGALALSAAGLDLADVRARITAATRPPAEPLDADALASLGIDLDEVRRATEASFGHGALDRAAHPAPESSWGAMRLTRPAKKSLEFALKAAVKLHSGHISSAHMVLGLIDQGNNGALMALTAVGADVPALRADVMARLAAAA
jgi:ATP-dependent Clp protease ATP-binding subunit ClpA